MRALNNHLTVGGLIVRRLLIRDGAQRTIGIGWRKGSAREEEFRLLGNFMSDNR